ncbi:MAG: NTP transferase domain-containing protein [Phycisphaerae bacterium]
MSTGSPAAVVLAAGRSTRMKSALPKVMHEVCGRAMLAYVLDACRAAGLGRIVVVVGYGKESVIEAFRGARDVTFVEQREQKGTGHAVQMAEPALRGNGGAVVVIAGDMPLVRGETLAELLATHAREQASAAIATTVLADPAGYGRIVRDDAGEFCGIVEDRDCDAGQRAIREVNPSYYCFAAGELFDALNEVRPNNAKSEYYITDVLTILRQRGRRVIAKTSVAAEDATGVNSRAELAEIARLMQARIQRAVMDAGVTIVSPGLTWIESGAEFGAETVIQPLTFVGRGARVGAGCTLGPGAVVMRGAVVPDGATVSGGDAALATAARQMIEPWTAMVSHGGGPA